MNRLASDGISRPAVVSFPQLFGGFFLDGFIDKTAVVSLATQESG